MKEVEIQRMAKPASGLLKALLAASVLFFAGVAPAHADRAIPSGMLVGVVDSAMYPQITLRKPKPPLLTRMATLGLYKKTITYRVAPSVRIRDEDNRFMVYGMLPKVTGKVVGLKSDFSGQVSQVWVLTGEEAVEYARRPDTHFPK
ncbi:hypothetical protein D3C78_971380 [compost metagenome]